MVIPRWAMVVIPIAVVVLCVAPAINEQILLCCVGWPLKMIGQFSLKWGLASLALFGLICFGYRKLVVK